MDAFNVAFRIPNLLRDLFAETALSAAFVPVLTAEKAKSKEAENRLASNIFNVLFVAAGAISLVGLLAAPYLAKAIAFGFGRVPGKIDLTAQLTAVLFPFLLFVSLAAWAMSYLNTERSFFVPSVAPAIFNLFSILFPVLTYGWYVAHGKKPIFGLAVGVLVGGLMQFLVQVPSPPAQGLSLESRPELPRSAVQKGHGSCLSPSRSGSPERASTSSSTPSWSRRWPRGASAGSPMPSGSCTCPSASSASLSGRSPCPPSRSSPSRTMSRPSSPPCPTR